VDKLVEKIAKTLTSGSPKNTEYYWKIMSKQGKKNFLTMAERIHQVILSDLDKEKQLCNNYTCKDRR